MSQEAEKGASTEGQLVATLCFLIGVRRFRIQSSETSQPSVWIQKYRQTTYHPLTCDYQFGKISGQAQNGRPSFKAKEAAVASAVEDSCRQGVRFRFRDTDQKTGEKYLIL